MFQSFDTEGDRTLGKERVDRLREWLAEKDLDGFLVPPPTSIRANMSPPVRSG